MHDEYKNDIATAWIHVLLEEYESIRRSAARLQSLRLPNFAVNDRCHRKLGEWNEQTRTITLSQRLVTEGAWSDVVDTLKHEMAHQIVSELFHQSHEPAHGAAFREACGILGIEATATACLSASTGATPNRMQRRIEKLFALTASPNPHEAERALEKAHELALKYNLDIVANRTPPKFALRPLAPLWKRTPSYIWGILRILQDYYFVLYIRRPVQARMTPGGVGGSTQVIEIYGRPDNLETAEYIYYFLLHRGEMEWDAYRQACGKVLNRRARISFLDGLYGGFHQTLATHRQVLAQEQSLVWRGDPDLGAFYRRRNPRVRSSTTSVKVNWHIHEDGTRVGRNLRLHHGLPRGSARGSGIAGLLAGRHQEN